MLGLVVFASLTLSSDAPASPPGHAVATPPGHAVEIEDPGGRALWPFHESLRRTEGGMRKTRVLFFGASHTAADLLTGRIRDNLQARFGDGGHGFFMPAKPWKSYRKQHMAFEAPKRDAHRWQWEFVRLRAPPREDGLYGLAGMAVEASEKSQWSRFRTASEGDSGARAAKVELWYHRRPDGGSASLAVSGEKGKNRFSTRGALGVGIFEVTFRDVAHAFELVPKGNGPVRLYGGVLERNAMGVVVDNLGINGAKAGAMLHWDESLWTRLVRRRDPALVVLAYGTNEAADATLTMDAYEADLLAVMERVRRAAPRASCLLVGPSDHPVSLDPDKIRRDPDKPKRFRVRPRTAAVIDVQRRLSAQFGCGFFDLVRVTGGPFSIVSWVDWRPQLAWHDYVHFTQDGYAMLGDRLTTALLRDYER